MPYDDPDATDPMMLVGVELPGDVEQHVEAASAVAGEFASLGFGEEKLMDLFRDPFYAGAHASYRVLGEEKVRGIVREHLAVWGAIRFRDRDVDPDTAVRLLPVLEPGVARRDENGNA